MQLRNRTSRRALVALTSAMLLLTACNSGPEVEVETSTTDDASGDDATDATDDTSPDDDASGSDDGTDGDDGDDPTASDTDVDEAAATASPSATEGSADDDVRVPAKETTTFEIVLTGAAEVPGPGQEELEEPLEVVLEITPQATGRTEVCLSIPAGGSSFDDLSGDLDGMHIHEGAVGVAGPVILGIGPLLEAEAGQPKVCARVDVDKAQDVLDDPSGYYLNVHSSDYPQGAVRGQLA